MYCYNDALEKSLKYEYVSKEEIIELIKKYKKTKNPKKKNEL